MNILGFSLLRLFENIKLSSPKFFMPSFFPFIKIRVILISNTFLWGLETIEEEASKMSKSDQVSTSTSGTWDIMSHTEKHSSWNWPIQWVLKANVICVVFSCVEATTVAGKAFLALARILAPHSVAMRLCQSGGLSCFCVVFFKFFYRIPLGLNETALVCHKRSKKLSMSSFSPICKMVTFIQVFLQNVFSLFVWGLENLIPVVNWFF